MTSVLPRASTEVFDDIEAAVTGSRVSADDGALSSVEIDGLEFDDDVAVTIPSARVEADPIASPTHTPSPTSLEVGSPAAAPAERHALTDLQRSMLIFERQWWRHAGSKEQAIREQFALSATRYYQMLNQLLEVPEALAFDPLVVGRLRRLRTSRSRSRMAT